MEKWSDNPLIPTGKREKLTRCMGADCLVASIWNWITEESQFLLLQEPQLHALLSDVVKSRSSLEASIAARLARKLSRRDMTRDELEPLLYKTLSENRSIVESMVYDLCAIIDRDPACASPLQALLFYKGFHALSTYRISHYLWKTGRCMLSYFFQHIGSEIFGVDIHPAARIGHGILLDHATSVVIGETSIVENDVSILHEVTLGGTGKQEGDRHPIVKTGVLIGAGAKILGRVTIGERAKIGAGSVVLTDVPPHTTVAGVPAQVVGETKEGSPALDMWQDLECCEKQTGD